MKYRLILSQLAFLCFVHNITGQSLKKQHIITSGSLPYSIESIVVSDLNNNGNKDIVTNCMAYNMENIYMLENLGSENFSSLKEVPIGWNLDETNMIKAGDINNDGLTDIVFSRYDYGSQLRWLRNTGNNNFEYGGTLFSITSSGWRSVTHLIADLNGDNCDDLIIGCRYHDDYNLEVKLNKGDGTFFSNFSLIDEGKLWEYHCSDIDQDNDIDIIYYAYNPYKIAVSLNNGYGEFLEEIILDTNENQTKYSLQIFDIDKNNTLDVLGFTGDSMALFLNNGENVFSQMIIPKDSLFSTNGTKTIDFDNDGDMDMINKKFNVLENLGNYSFFYHEYYDNPLWIVEFEVVDINNNSDEDIIFGLVNGGIGYIEDVSSETLDNWVMLTSKVMVPEYPAFEKVNDDEYNDIAILDHDFKYVFFLNNANNEFYDTISFNKLHSYYDQSTFFDINKDGFCDIASYSNYDFVPEIDSASFKLAKNNGNNTFSRLVIDDFDNIIDRYAYFNDYNNDSILDAFLIPYSSSRPTDSIYHLTIGSDFVINMFDTIILNRTIKISQMKFYDFDFNGEDDILLSSEDSIFMLNSFNGIFSDSLVLLHASNNLFDFNALRINDDSLSDLMYLSYWDASVKVNYNGINFEQSFSLGLDDYYRNSYIVDLDNDNMDELICCSNETLKLFDNIGQSNQIEEEYDYRHDYYHFREPSLIFKDVDLDGDKDIICTSRTHADLSWFENSFVDTLDYSRFPEKNAVWTEQNAIYEGNPPQTWTSLYVTKSDTTIHNNSYTNIYEYYLNPNTFDTIRQLYASIRQKVLEKKVYIIRHYLSEIDEKLLLDFKVNIGDTILLNAYYWDLDPVTTDSIFVLDSTNTITIHNGEERDILYLSNHKEQTSVSLSLIEGVGSIENPFGPATNLVKKKRTIRTELCCPDYLICLSENDEIVYVDSEESRCNTLEVWTSIETETQNQFLKIYPNPTKDKINIEFLDKPLLDFEVVLYNNHGSKLGHFYYEKNEQTQTIDFHNYKSGLYLIKISYGNKSNSFKIIKTE